MNFLTAPAESLFLAGPRFSIITPGIWLYNRSIYNGTLKEKKLEHFTGLEKTGVVLKAPRTHKFERTTTLHRPNWAFQQRAAGPEQQRRDSGTRVWTSSSVPATDRTGTQQNSFAAPVTVSSNPTELEPEERQQNPNVGAQSSCACFFHGGIRNTQSDH